MKTWQAILFGLFIGIISTGLILLISAPPRGTAIKLIPKPTPKPIVVYVTGMVENPGLYNLPYNSRVFNAIEAAGGMVAEADQQSINLAKRIHDEEKIVVPAIESIPINNENDIQKQQNPTNSEINLPPSSEHPININTASAVEIETLPYIGTSKAQSIIKYRQENGNFLTKEDIMKVSGIGESIYSNIEDLITISN